jgi:Phosphotransferase enzyme family
VSKASLPRGALEAWPSRHETESREGVEGSLRTAVERIVKAELGTTVRVVSVSCEPSRFATASPAEIVTVGLRNGSSFRLFVKRLEADQSANPDKARRDREPLVYRRLLGRRGLPAPICYGSRSNSAPPRHELFLEHINDWNLKYHGLDHWHSAARALARLHAHFAAREDELDRSDFLLQLDSGYFHAWGVRALEAVSAASSERGRKLELVLRRHDEIAGLLAEQPRTLVHNDLAPKNVIAETSTAPARILFVDWEMAGVGCGLLDLAHLKHGLREREERRLCDAYRSELGKTGVGFDAQEFRRLLAACDSHNTLYRLAHARGWGLPHTTIDRWIEDVGRLARHV